MRKRRSGEEGEEGDGGVREAGRSEGGREGRAGRQADRLARERASERRQGQSHSLLRRLLSSFDFRFSSLELPLLLLLRYSLITALSFTWSCVVHFPTSSRGLPPPPPTPPLPPIPLPNFVALNRRHPSSTSLSVDEYTYIP